VLADDHPMYRYGVAAVLATAAEIELVGEASDGVGLIALVAAERPDVVLTDLAMPGLDGVSACRELLARQPDLGVLVLTMHADDESLVSALRAGARGYLVKGADKAELIRAILAVADGQAVYGAVVARRIAELFGSARPPLPFPDLTPREREVLTLLADGARNSEIARQLGMTDKTVRNHVSAILMKLQVTDRTAAAIKARGARWPRPAVLYAWRRRYPNPSWIPTQSTKMITGVSHSDRIGVPVAHRTSTKATTASASLTCWLRLTMTFSMGFMTRSSSAAASCSRLNKLIASIN
jgi:DNA-binding NarL/FixJ family response regulator